jgi:hypothetical protein
VARARLLKPGFFKNEELARLPYETRLCYAGLWTLADREGRLEDRPERIKVELFPYDDAITSGSVDAMCTALQIAGFIVRFGVKGGVGKVTRYMAIPTFLEHQTPHHREHASRIPAPPSRLLKPKASPKTQPQTEPKASPEAQPTSSPTVTVPVLVPDPVTGDGDPVPRTKDQSSPADAGPSLAPANGNGTTNLAVITRIAHEALQLLGPNHEDLAETVKNLCAQRHIAYNSDVVRKALDSADAQRRRP